MLYVTVNALSTPWGWDQFSREEGEFGCSPIRNSYCVHASGSVLILAWHWLVWSSRPLCPLPKAVNHRFPLQITLVLSSAGKKQLFGIFFFFLTFMRKETIKFYYSTFQILLKNLPPIIPSSQYCRSDNSCASKNSQVYRNFSVCNYLHGNSSDEKVTINENQIFCLLLKMNTGPSF